MKKIFSFGSFLFVLMFSLFLPHLNVYPEESLPQADSPPGISMDLKDANLKDVLKLFSIQSGMNFIASGAVQDRKITLYLDKVPVEQAMDKIFKANNLSYDYYRDSNIFIVKDWGKLQIETETRIFYLKHAMVSTSSIKQEMSNILLPTPGGQTASAGGGSSGKWKSEDEAGLTTVVKKLLSNAGFLIEDYRTNSLIVTDTPSRLEVIAKVIASLDIPIPQVLLEVEMLDVSKNAIDKLGVQWPTTLASLTVPGSRETSFPFGSKGTSGADRRLDPALNAFGGPGTGWDFGSWAASHFGPSILTVIGTTLTLDFLKSQTDTKYLARPRLLTLNNETAEIRISTKESIGVSTTTTSAGGTTGSTTASAERAETGVILRITPQVNLETGEITMFIYPKVSEAIQGSTITIGGESSRFRDPEERSTKSLVKVKDGETVVIGGLLRDEFSQVTEKLPILGDLPFIGGLFRHTGGDTDKNRQRELLIFITPRIVKDSGMKLARTEKGTFSEREQNTASALNREVAIHSSLNRFDK
ncbi:MAG: secretin N-terminal domain-containing protein [Candidatus Omnitrophota bacterium]